MTQWFYIATTRMFRDTMINTALPKVFDPAFAHRLCKRGTTTLLACHRKAGLNAQLRAPTEIL